MGNNKKKFEIPTTCALLFMLLLFCAVLTWIIPAGAYDTEKVGNTNRVIAGTYHVIESTPVGPWAAMMAVTGGFYKAAKLMIMIMFCGGAVEILEKSGAISAAFGKLASNKNMNVNLLVFILMAFMSIGGAAGVFANPVVALVPIGVILMKNLGYDAFAGFLLVYMGAYSGFNVGWANASTIGTAQPIAELPIFSGFSVRVILNVINFIICYFFTIKYMKTIKANPKKSLNYEEGLSVHEYMGGGKAEDGRSSLGAAAVTGFLAAAQEHGGEGFQLRGDIQCAGTLGAVDFMGAYSHQVNTESGGLDGHFAESLNGIAMNDCGRTGHHCRPFCRLNGHYCSHLVVDKHHRNKNCV